MKSFHLGIFITLWPSSVTYMIRRVTSALNTRKTKIKQMRHANQKNDQQHIQLRVRVYTPRTQSRSFPLIFMETMYPNGLCFCVDCSTNTSNHTYTRTHAPATPTTTAKKYKTNRTIF